MMIKLFGSREEPPGCRLPAGQHVAVPPPARREPGGPGVGAAGAGDPRSELRAEPPAGGREPIDLGPGPRGDG